MPTATRSGSWYVIIAALLWSTGGFFIKDVTLDGYSVSLWRSLFASLTLFIIYKLTVGKKATARTEGWFTARTIGTALIYSALLILFVLATKLTTSANAIFLQYTAPIYVLFFEPIISKSKIKRGDIIAVLITISAMGLFFIGKFDTTSTLGNILALTSGVCFAAYALLLKHEKTDEAMRWQSVIVGHGIIVISMLILWVMGITDPLPHHPKELLELSYLGIFQIGVAYALFTTGIHYIRALDALLLSMIEPVLNPVWVFLGIGETPTYWAIIGGAIILVVSAIRTYREGKVADLVAAE